MPKHTFRSSKLKIPARLRVLNLSELVLLSTQYVITRKISFQALCTSAVDAKRRMSYCIYVEPELKEKHKKAAEALRLSLNQLWDLSVSYALASKLTAADLRTVSQDLEPRKSKNFSKAPPPAKVETEEKDPERARIKRMINENLLPGL